MSEKKSWTKSFFIGSWNVINFTRKFVLNIIFFIILIAVLVGISNSGVEKAIVPNSSALVLNLSGNLVIEKQYVDPAEKFAAEAFGQGTDNPEILVRDLVKVINNAKEDKRIKAIVLQLDGLGGGGLDKMRLVAEALTDFKESGKPIYAMGDYYGQNQYYLAAHADNVYLNPMGAMIIEGYGRYRMYYKEGLEKLRASVHVFKVGKFKSAVEPYLRDDMSPEARLANEAWMNELWSQYKSDVTSARKMELSNFDEKMEQLIPKFESVNGDFAQYALQNGWIDGLRSRNDFREEMVTLLGEADNKMGYNTVKYENYLSLITPKIPLPESNKQKVAIVIAKGTILDGTQKPGTIGGDSTAQLLREARLDDNVKAVVLQVDSGGGSAFASEVIRKEIDLIKAAGKPVVASMATYAASGGYWISASADEIFAEPSTITGSIGIFGMMTTFERTLEYVGVRTDGVGTTELAGMSPTRGLSPGIKQIIQMNIERGYERFINLVATERSMTAESVDEIAQGRVWIGTQALELGLVDKLGSLDDAVKSAAALAELEDYETKYIVRTLSDKELFWQNFLQGTANVFSGLDIEPKTSAFQEILSKVDADLKQFSQLNDPLATYAMCIECQVD
ncbi:signal peptide peptidase SppA [Brumicola nitratireducens]|uniref:Signal peptide peptidase SppA, 67K type n=1 Tax=Glaciecola nitratireducens (strain JCM 12485 / KCTC 12276 / FR1064) TaxID=1085623 RepID=G4QH37_GLANF|nr:signal peptide peptidase SppA [Glaciecola nitratireducens]AEP30225.1 signal peptide peptidase SppA, 67K type [Glaciecola nitratireducens FR1064]